MQGINISHGEGTTAIKVRLRPHNRPNEIFRFEVVLGTLLHELSHIVHHNHNAPFWKLLDELNKVA